MSDIAKKKIRPMTLERIRFSGFLWPVIFWLLPCLALAQRLPKPERVRVAYSSYGMSILPLMLGREMGFFKDEQLTVDMVMMTSALSGLALAAGDIDYSTMAGQLITQAVAGAPIKVVFVVINKPLFMFVGRPEIKTVRDLKNRAVGVGSHGAIDDLLARKVIETGGLDPEKDVTLLNLGNTSSRLGALKAGSIAATMLTVPFNLVAERMGYTRLAFAGDFMHPVINGLGVTDRKLREQRDQVKRMLKATLKAESYMRQYREESIQKAIAWYKFDRQGAELAYDMSMRRMPENGLAPDESFKIVIDSSRGRQLSAGQVPVSKVADFSVLKEILKETHP